MITAPLCPYCGLMSDPASGRQIYPHRQDLYDKRFFLCRPCDAYVGCHADNGRPMGRLANKELRELKIQVHARFDPLWREFWRAYPETPDRAASMQRAQRGRAYAWLANAMGIPVADCHVGMFDEDQCRRALLAMAADSPTPLGIRHWWKSQSRPALKTVTPA